MLDLRELYQEMILDHHKNPRHHHTMDDATSFALGVNPLCGDKLTVYLQVINGMIRNISFTGCGCAISQASASLMTDALNGKPVETAEDLFAKFHHMLTSPKDDLPPAALEKLTVFSGVRAYPARVKCATLAWHTLHAALKKENMTVTTE